MVISNSDLYFISNADANQRVSQKNLCHKLFTMLCCMRMWTDVVYVLMYDMLFNEINVQHRKK